jgi:bacterioferritin-associated ferredoxin
VSKSKKLPNQIICFCNNVSKQTIEEAIQKGCHTLNEIYDTTTAGVGPCGGSCRRKIAPMLEEYLANGKFSEKADSEENGTQNKASGNDSSSK